MFNFAERGLVLYPPGAQGTTLGFYDVFPNGDFVVLSRAANDSSRAGIVALLNWQQLLKPRSSEAEKR